MNITINGTKATAAEGASLHDVLAEFLAGDERVTTGAGLAAAVNSTVVAHPAWAGHALADGDVIEVLTAFVGG